MASHFQSALHLAARNTILLWLGCATLIAGICVLITYHALRDQSIQVTATAPLLSKRNATAPIRPVQPARAAKRTTDSSAEVARAHTSAVAAAVGSDAAPTKTEPAKQP